MRLNEADRTNRPLRAILSDTTLLELSRKPPKSIEDIAQCRSIRPDQARSMGQQIFSVVEKACQQDEALYPSWPNGRSTAKSEVLLGDMLYAVLKVLSYKENIATELVATREDVQNFVRLAKENRLTGADLPLLNDWRAEIAGNTLAKLLSEGNLNVSFAIDQDPPVWFSCNYSAEGEKPRTN
jgi:ribonuclease D